MIERIAWAVQPGTSNLNRPRRLVASLQAHGLIHPEAVAVHHGRAKSTSGAVRGFPLLPGMSLRGSASTAVLSPIFLVGGSSTPSWIDVYDDWSLAPDINRYYRFLADLGYRRLRGRRTKMRVTANTPYMAKKVDGSVVVPNGVEPSWAQQKKNGGDTRTAIMLGHFFKGRTDLDLMSAVIGSDVVDRVIIGGPGSDSDVQSVLVRGMADYPGKIRVLEWMSEADISAACGTRTVAVVPNIVNDYTLSQDLMKAYSFAALGIPIVCPVELMPAAIPRELSIGLKHGDSICTALRIGLSRKQGNHDDRQDFIRRNSWDQRAIKIAELLSQ